jgi:hypothetical protein
LPSLPLPLPSTRFRLRPPDVNAVSNDDPLDVVDSELTSVESLVVDESAELVLLPLPLPLPLALVFALAPRSFAFAPLSLSSLVLAFSSFVFAFESEEDASTPLSLE